MRYVFDIDGTICSHTNGNYSEAVPFEDRIEIINELYDMGNVVWFQTARGMGRHGNDQTKAHANFYQLTFDQLTSWGVKFHGLMMGKVAGDVYIDDRGRYDLDFFDGGQR